jgi:D-3-phosphoglycerate dehydrogenase
VRIPPEADAALVRLFRVDRAVLDGATRLRVIGRHGVGLDSVDMIAATARGIAVVYTPEANSNAVAEHTIALILALARQIPSAAAAVAEGRFADRDRFRGIELAGRTLGIVGMGRIGKRVGEIAASGLAMRVIGHDPLLPAEGWPTWIDRQPTALELFATSDVVSLHVPLTDKTRHLVNASVLASARPGCRIINTSRGAVIDERALADALFAGTIAGAALDVFEVEPLPAGHPLFSAPNVVLTPHIASLTAEALDRMALHAAEGIVDVLNGRKPKYLANPEVLR